MTAAKVSILGAGVIAPSGIGFASFAAALHAGGGQCGGGPLGGFDVRDHLGAKGVGSLDRPAQLAIVVCREAFARVGQDLDAADVGVVLGTIGGGTHSISEFVRSTYTAPLPYMISPLQVPNTVMNCAAAQCAIWLGLRGVNSTVCAGEMSGLAALQYAARMLRLGHARLLIAGSVGEYCAFSAHSHAATSVTHAPPAGEGAAVFSLAIGETRNEPIADMLAIRVRARGHAVADRAEVRREEAQAALAASGIGPDDLVWWSGEDDVSPEDVLGVGRVPVSVPSRTTALCGSTYAASTSLQLAGALALAPAGPGLLMSQTRDGQIGCAVMNIRRPYLTASA